MKTIKLVFQCIMLVIMFLVMVFTLSFPFIISYITGNWWLMFLYAVIGIPFMIELTILMLILNLD